MPEPGWRISPLQRRHQVDAFDSGAPSLDEYLRKYASQNERLGLSRAFVATRPDDDVVLGYYTLSAGAVQTELLSDRQRKRLPRYPVPVAHLGRLARDASVRGQGMGPFLLIDAMRRTLAIADALGVHAMEVIAKDEAAREFYARYGFTGLQDDPRHLYMPLKTIRKLDLP